MPHCGSQLCSQIRSLSCSSRRESEGRQQQPQEQYSHHDPVQTLALWHLPNPVCASTVGMLCHSTILALMPGQRRAACLAVHLLLPPPSPLPPLRLLLFTSLALGTHCPCLSENPGIPKLRNSLKNLFGHCYFMLLSNRYHSIHLVLCFSSSLQQNVNPSSGSL